ncbi:MAG: sodium:solute symporter [Gammaproteobacteria bacterium]|nr:MAG: sodium:solute symporter [Gammaproteobacteria bacterium]
MAVTYTGLDWAVFIAYGLLLAISGWWVNRKKVASSSEYFLGGNAMPMWMVAISVLATSQSAATFLGGPDMGYRGDLSYLATNIGAFIAAFFVAIYLIPKFYQYKVFTVYELLEQQIGPKAKKHAGIMYLFGRVFASGARLYMAAIAVAMILFGNIHADSVVIATIIISIIGLLFSVFGGVRSVIYSDVIQAAVYVSAALFVIYFLYAAIPADFSQIMAVLESPANGEPSKLALFKFNWDMSGAGVFNFWSAITGFVLLNIAAFGLDQDMTQRVLTCKTAKEGSKAMLFSVLMVIPVMLLFLIIGLLLYVFYQRPDLMLNDSAVQAIQTFDGEKVTIFMSYVLNEIPSGVRGLVTIGIIAAALSTLNSGLSSMSSVIVQDIYRPFVEQKNIRKADSHYVNAGKIAMIIVAIALASMSVLSFYWQQYSDMPLLTFALSVMLFSYSGLLGVYFTALFTRRGSENSVLAALIVGFVVTLLMQPYIQSLYLSPEQQFDLAFTWKLCIATFISTLICMLGKRNVVARNQEPKQQVADKYTEVCA